MSTLNHTLTHFFKSKPSMQQHGPLIVAVSGGRDSICLLHWLTHSTLITTQIIAVTIDHHLRPESASECEQVCQMATKWGAGCQTKQTQLTADTFTENSARHARYAILQDVAHKANAQHILTGHHAGDQAETILLHLMRGSGLTGLTGMQAESMLQTNGKTAFRLIRPMLAVTPAMLDAYAAEHDLSYFDDPSNTDEKFTRNRIRHTLIPLIEDQFNRQIQKSLSQMGQILQDDLIALETVHADYLAKADQNDGLGWCSLDFQVWKNGSVSFQRYALRYLYAQIHGSAQDLTQENLEAARSGLAQQKTDRRYQLSGSVWVQKVYGMLLAHHQSAVELFDMPQITLDQAEFEIRTDRPTTIKLSNGQWQVHIDPIRPEVIHLAESAANRWVAFVAIGETAVLTLRGRRQSETFRPFRFDGDVSLKNLMIDRKIPAILRDRWPLITDETGILWVAGHRLAARAAVTADTRFAVKISLEKCSEPR